MTITNNPNLKDYGFVETTIYPPISDETTLLPIDDNEEEIGNSSSNFQEEITTIVNEREEYGIFDDDITNDYDLNEESDIVNNKLTTINPPVKTIINPPKSSSTTIRTYISTPQDFNLEKSTTKPPKKSNELTENIVETLAKLFFKTLDLSIKIKTALDDSQNGEKIVNIVSKKDETENEIVYPQLIKDLPDFIKITPDDAIVVNQEDNLIQENDYETEAFEPIYDLEKDTIKPIVILIEDSANIIVNTTDGEIVTVDFSDLPKNDPVMREIIIRLV